MTEKRFKWCEKIVRNIVDEFVVDTLKDSRLDEEDMYYLLNELNDENEQLKQKHRQLQIEFNDACIIVKDLRESKLDLEDENEQLKHDASVLIQANKDYRIENEQLKSNIDIRDKGIIELKEENEQLKQQYIDEYALRETLQQELQRVENENEVLKSQLKYARNFVYRNNSREVNTRFYEELQKKGDVE